MIFFFHQSGHAVDTEISKPPGKVRLVLRDSNDHDFHKIQF